MVYYFYINMKPYSVPLRFKRNASKEEILKEFPTAFNIVEV